MAFSEHILLLIIALIAYCSCSNATDLENETRRNTDKVVLWTYYANCSDVPPDSTNYTCGSINPEKSLESVARGLLKAIAKVVAKTFLGSVIKHFFEYTPCKLKNPGPSNETFLAATPQFTNETLAEAVENFNLTLPGALQNLDPEYLVAPHAGAFIAGGKLCVDGALSEFAKFFGIKKDYCFLFGEYGQFNAHLLCDNGILKGNVTQFAVYNQTTAFTLDTRDV